MSDRILPVTNEDVAAAWEAFYNDGVSAPKAPPKPDDWLDRIILIGIRRAIESDRKRVAERSLVTEGA